MRKVGMVVSLVLLAVASVASVAQAVTIYDVQYSDAASSWQSALAGQTVNVTGGVVTYSALPPGKQSFRVAIQDPAFAEWGGVEIKIFSGTLGQGVQVGDRVDLTNVRVDETTAGRGTTYLLFDQTAYGSAFTVVSSGNAIPPTVVSPAVLGGGDTSGNPALAERYEGMLLSVQDVTIGNMNLGSAADNYQLIGADGNCWASDYQNTGRVAGQKYAAGTTGGLEIASLTGIFEQYTKTSDGYDYYQLLPRSDADVVVPEPATATLLASAVLSLLAARKRRR